MPLASQMASMTIIPDEQTTCHRLKDKVGILVVGIGGYNGTTVRWTIKGENKTNLDTTWLI
jgi:hypothetical protein